MRVFFSLYFFRFIFYYYCSHIFVIQKRNCTYFFLIAGVETTSSLSPSCFDDKHLRGEPNKKKVTAHGFLFLKIKEKKQAIFA